MTKDQAILQANLEACRQCIDLVFAPAPGQPTWLIHTIAFKLQPALAECEQHRKRLHQAARSK